MRTKAQSSIIISIILILIALAALILVSRFVINFIKDKTQVEESDLSFYIDPAYTYFDSSANNGLGIGIENEIPIMLINLKKNSGVTEYNSLKFVFFSGSRSFNCYTNNVPSNLESKFYYVPLSIKPDSFQIVPIQNSSGYKEFSPTPSTNVVEKARGNNVNDPRFICLSCDAGNTNTELPSIVPCPSFS